MLDWESMYTFNKILGIKHGRYFEDLRNLQKAIDKRGRLSKSYFSKPENSCVFVDENSWYSKADLDEVKHELLLLLVPNALNGFAVTSHGTRVFHALAILKVDKTSIEKATCEDCFCQNACVDLWQLDDGSVKAGNIITTLGDDIFNFLLKIRNTAKNNRHFDEALLKEMFKTLEPLNDGSDSFYLSVQSAYLNILKACKSLLK